MYLISACCSLLKSGNRDDSGDADRHRLRLVGTNKLFVGKSEILILLDELC